MNSISLNLQRPTEVGRNHFTEYSLDHLAGSESDPIPANIPAYVIGPSSHAASERASERALDASANSKEGREVKGYQSGILSSDGQLWKAALYISQASLVLCQSVGRWLPALSLSLSLSLPLR